MAFEKPAVVLDNGSYTIKAGFACDNHPLTMFRTVLGRPAKLNGGYGKENYEVFIGEEALVVPEYEMFYPVLRGKIVHWDNMERLWHHMFYRELKVAPEDRAVIMGCSSDTTMAEKIKCCEIFFETLNSPALCIQPQCVLSMYGSGSTTGVCVDLAYDKAEVSPIYEGGLIRFAVTDTKLSSINLKKFLSESLEGRGLMFEKTTKILMDLEKMVYVSRDLIFHRKNSLRYYKLPDGKVIDVSDECMMAGELLFQPDEASFKKTEYQSLQGAIMTCCMKCDADLRPLLFDNIVPCGGMSVIPGLNVRLDDEMKKLTESPVTISTSPEPYVVSWLGGATFAGMKGAQSLWVTKKQYEDYGVKIIKNKFL